MSIKSKYSVEQWVISEGQLKEGDIIAYEGYDGKEVKAIFEGLLNNGKKSVIVVKKIGTDLADIIDLYTTIVYKIGETESKSLNGCSCGAAYTSNKNYHLRFCDLGEK